MNQDHAKILGLKVDLILYHWNNLFYVSETELQGTEYVGHPLLKFEACCDPSEGHLKWHYT